MSTDTTFSIDQVTLDTAVPTELPLKELFTWVIWQFPRKQGNGLLGAVRPPTSKYGWFPAIIHNKNKTVMVHGHVERPFDSPEAAVDYFNKK
jgi:hypothetical protein